eukprot:CAMPEP_0184501292 /NCGR_PEP_ID=MMETSP0113_2-20130426/47226_1 /TAXON_ID=91329 /ORGANISM="Norrisiella sphaerica, Strain BC52" /LENGTH=472 /DNA_ID=CAMNT_0026890007 /DNA_START=131 /DNA_END=1549 /DNA_ORIENTATION=+
MARALQQDFEEGLSEIGILYLLQSLIGCVFMPIWGVLGDRYSRKRLLIKGSLLWGFFTLLCASASSMQQFMLFRTTAAAFMYLVVPLTQSCVADMVSSERRGTLFGKLAFIGSLGTLSGQFVSTSVSENFYSGVRGWRIVLFGVGVVSIVFSWFMANFFVEPKRSQKRQDPGESVSLSRIDWASLRLKTFWLLVLQGVFGTIPWRAFGMFAVLWLEMIGYTPMQVAIVGSLGTFAGSIGSLLSGFIGDYAHRIVPFNGRIYVAQFSISAGILMVYFILNVIPKDGEHIVLFGVSVAVFRLVAGWASNGTNRPVVADIAPPWSRASMYSYFCAMENIPSSFSGYVVSYLAEKWFGFRAPEKGSAEQFGQGGMSNQETAANVVALTSALRLMTLLPWTIAVSFYGLMHFTYKKDVELTESRMGKFAAKGKVASSLGESEGSTVEKMNLLVTDEEADHPDRFSQPGSEARIKNSL